MELKRKQRKHAFLQFEIKALRELLEKLSWMDRMWLLIETLVGGILIVMSCNG